MDDSERRWVLSVLAGAQQDDATELVMSPAQDGGTAVRYKVGDAWHAWASAGVPWSGLLSEVAGLAGIRDAPFPKEGLIYIAYSGVRLRWKVRLTNEDSACDFQNLGSGLV
jgi:hypothetical protein